MIFLRAGIVPALASAVVRGGGHERSSPPSIWHRLRRRARRRRRELRGRARRDVLDHRPERRRQDHAVQPDVRPLPAGAAAGCGLPARTSPASCRTQLARRGLSRTFQNLQIFFRMTRARKRHGRPPPARDDRHARRSPASARRSARQNRRRATPRRRRCSTSSGWRQSAERPAGSLPYGALKRLEIARALASEPQGAAARRARRRLQCGRDRGDRRGDPRRSRATASRSCWSSTTCGW